MDISYWLGRACAAVDEWAAVYGPPLGQKLGQKVDEARFAAAFDAFSERLKDNYPYFHPRYAGQMLKPPHPAAVVGYLGAMLINPNNHALDSGPATARMEKESVATLATMFGFDQHLGHLTGSGTIANLEALFVARELHPDRGVAFSAEAHYTHARACHLLGIRGYPVPADASGRMDLDALRELLDQGQVGTVVATAGTTALGAIDPVGEIVALAREHGVRVHVDAAYGGFFALLAGTELDPAPWRALSTCDSIVVDPHKHGLQPYGCGAVLFADPGVGRFYQHDSPYTYFTSGDLHLGEISLECSRPGAAAAALWLTLQLFPASREGLGEVLAAGRRAALRWAELIDAAAELTLYQPPQLDIVTYFPTADTLSAVDAGAHRMLTDGMRSADPVYLSTLWVSAEDLARRGHAVEADRPRGRILRSVLMKPEHEAYLPDLHARVLELAREEA